MFTNIFLKPVTLSTKFTIIFFIPLHLKCTYSFFFLKGIIIAFYWNVMCYSRNTHYTFTIGKKY